MEIENSVSNDFLIYIRRLPPIRCGHCDFDYFAGNMFNNKHI